MKVRYYIDPETGQPHIYKHNVTESEVEEILAHPGEDRAGRDGAPGWLLAVPWPDASCA
jgi:hypothetical protein